MDNKNVPQAGIPIQPLGQNPLQKHFRQPKIYLKLPSQGRWYPNGAIDLPENGEIPIYSMTAKDELTFKTPDALLNGQSVVDVIQSCAPNIKNAWAVPSVDLDCLLVAIRMATFGEKLEVNVNIPNTEIQKAYEVDCKMLIDRYINAKFQDVMHIDGFTVTLKPISYRVFTQMAIKTFEEQRLLSTVNNEDIDSGQKLERFNKSFQVLTDINVQIMKDAIVSIRWQNEEEVTNPTHIAEFIDSADAKVFNGVKKHIDENKKQFQVQPMQVNATDEEIKAGAPKQFDVPISFDQANFFA
tara:strand:+ start:3053 stop:3946 length:894 start_codon:yes stop_codon:yes gene_type:complete